LRGCGFLGGHEYQWTLLDHREYPIAHVLAIAYKASVEFSMSGNTGNIIGKDEIPASLQRKAKEPAKMVNFRIPLSWWDELSSLAREFDQDVSTFLREATEDWLRRASKVRRRDTSGK
jgi:hypothetical protein